MHLIALPEEIGVEVDPLNTDERGFVAFVTPGRAMSMAHILWHRCRDLLEVDDEFGITCARAAKSIETLAVQSEVDSFLELEGGAEEEDA